MKVYHGLLVAMALGLTGCASFWDDFWGNTDEHWLRARTSQYQQQGQDPESARRNATYDFVWVHNRFPD